VLFRMARRGESRRMCVYIYRMDKQKCVTNAGAWLLVGTSWQAERGGANRCILRAK